MRQSLLVLTFSLAASFSVSCYHARIETGLQPSAKVVEKPFAACWIYGLVPPSVVNMAQDCPDGVAIVETQQSFVNGLVGILTLGIYTPINIKVTCASSASMGSLDIPADNLVVPNDASEQAVMEAFALAAERAAASKQPVYVHFE